MGNSEKGVDKTKDWKIQNVSALIDILQAMHLQEMHVRGGLSAIQAMESERGGISPGVLEFRAALQGWRTT